MSKSKALIDNLISERSMFNRERFELDRGMEHTPRNYTGGVGNKAFAKLKVGDIVDVRGSRFGVSWTQGSRFGNATLSYENGQEIKLTRNDKLSIRVRKINDSQFVGSIFKSEGPTDIKDNSVVLSSDF